MLYTKDGFPEVNEIVLCEVTKISGNTTFVDVKEYEKEGVLIISEIAPGRIRNLRDHVVEGKTIVCKVLRVDERNNRVDVSLRRVPIPVMKDKLEEIKKEEYAEKIYMDVSKELQITKDDLFEKTYEIIFESYDTVFEALYDVMLDNSKVDMFTNLKDNEKQVLVKIINDRIKPEEVVFKKKFTLKSYSATGINEVKETLTTTLNSLNYSKVKIIYLAAGTYSISITHEDLKSASKVYSTFKQELEKNSKAKGLKVEISE